MKHKENLFTYIREICTEPFCLCKFIYIYVVSGTLSFPYYVCLWLIWVCMIDAHVLTLFNYVSNDKEHTL